MIDLNARVNVQASGLGLGLCGFGFGLVGPCVLAALVLGFLFFLLVVIRLMGFRLIIINILRRKKKIYIFGRLVSEYLSYFIVPRLCVCFMVATYTCTNH